MMTKMRLDNKWMSIMKESSTGHQELIDTVTATPIEATHRKAEAMTKAILDPMPKSKALGLYLFLGPLIGEIIFLFSMMYSRFDVKSLSDADTYKLIVLSLLISYPFAVAIGGIPALISGLLIHFRESKKMKYIRAGLIGFVVSILFYAPFLSGFNTMSGSMALIGAAAAVGTRFRINQLENRII